jgi:hypothetical protein
MGNIKAYARDGKPKPETRMLMTASAATPTLDPVCEWFAWTRFEFR